VRILLAGATGVVGRRLVPLLVAEGHHVTALTRRPHRIPELRRAGADAVVADVRDAGAVAATVRDTAPEVVVHQLTDLGAGDLAASADVTSFLHVDDAAAAAAAALSWRAPRATDQTVLIVAIIAMSSCSRLWQWKTNRPACSVNRTATSTTSAGRTSTVSFHPPS
jgi:uncharacterized protein YbjT (DUF2867 family)